MKAAVDHRVPLTDRMIGIIENQSRDSKFVFSGKNPNKKLPHEAMLKVLKASDRQLRFMDSDQLLRIGAASEPGTPTRL